MSRLIVTNGDCAAEKISRAFPEAEILPWRDVLHEGPVPGGLELEDLSALRAGFLASYGWGSREEILAKFQARDQRLKRVAEEEVILWFEHDLYDQLQLMQILDWFRRQTAAPALSLICRDQFISQIETARLSRLFEERQSVGAPLLERGSRAWRAFAGDQPSLLGEVAAEFDFRFPYFSLALSRWLEEFPGVREGLSRTEKQILEAVAEKQNRGIEIFGYSQECEPAAFLGDSAFWIHLRRLAQAPTPLLEPRDGGGVAGVDSELQEQSFQLTPEGEAVLKGELDFVELNGIDRWMGGYHLTTTQQWRFDPGQGRLIKRP